MPLSKDFLKKEIIKITDSNDPTHEGFPNDLQEASVRWSNAINLYASQIIPVSTTSESARVSLQAHLMTVPTLGEQGFINGLIAYSTVLATGMLPTFNGVIPPIPPVLTPAFVIGFNGGSSEDVAEQMSNIIDIWFKTGTAINISSGVVTNWN
jgi:hypothetical protein